MPVNARIRKSGTPLDLRDAGPASEVVQYWQPEAFTWYGREARGPAVHKELFITVRKGLVRISNGAVAAAGFAPGDRLELGFNSEYLAVRRGEGGIPARAEKAASKALCLGASRFVEAIAAAGWPVPCRAACVYDERSGMLVARKPEVNQR